MKLPFDRPPVQSCMRRRFAIVHTAAGRKVPFLARDGRSLEKIVEAAPSVNGMWARAVETPEKAIVSVADAIQTFASPAGRSNTAKGQTSRALLRRQAAARLCGP